MKVNLDLITSYPIGTGIYRVFENYFHLGFYSKPYYLSSINFNSVNVSSKPIYEEIHPKYLPNKISYILSFYFGNTLKNKIKNSYIHVLEPGFFHLSRYNIPTIGTVHDLYPLNAKTRYGYSNLYRLIYKKDLDYVKDLLGVTTVSHTTEKDLKRFYPNLKITTIHHWTPDYFIPINKSLCREKLNLPQSKNILLNISSNSNNKNLEFLGRVMDKLDDQFLLLYLGNGVINNIHKNRVKRINDFLDNGKLVQLYNSADLYLAPSTSEGFNFPVIEAINCGVPVIASKISTFEEVLFNSPYLLQLKEEMWVDMIINLSKKKDANEALSWYESNISNYYRESRGKEEFQELFNSLLG